ncbi:Phenylacetic acid catabolic protein, partial [Pseudomonas protegens]|uniref:Phenylacetic acid catabolic protein n=1 Tax=Pseudomonas protegens TaxID=380021 RepID=UPI00390606AB
QAAEAWRAKAETLFARPTLPVPEAPSHFYLDARRGLHTEHLGPLLAEMQFLPRAYPDAVW